MAVVHPTQMRRPRARLATVNIAGTAWPVFKLEALAIGVLIALVLLLVTGSAQTAVLVGATAMAVRWIVAVVRPGPRLS
ncbi:hypothetical protein OHB26_37360 [Nocardia sp. NBC_01503]|uniref:hypothetical protein n=1 Tax=Nocardia sp. NBC_01503 TaxID=2975997 RepID=UPI002E7B8824|nr:hypothetical protein [Nocardia sp. NBC_01503]WTL32466.1 hypothetical protein OHB26_37360 [Nocardia sp. NBC_01503]